MLFRSQLKALNPKSADSFTPEQIDGLTSTEAKSLSPSFVKGLSKECQDALKN